MAGVPSHVFMKASLLPVALLLAFLLGCSSPSTQEQLQSRMQVSGAVNKAVRAYQAKEKRWPKSMTDLVDGGHLKDLPSDRLDGVKYALVKSTEKDATYALTIDGKTRETKVPAWIPTQGTPTLGQATASGG